VPDPQRERLTAQLRSREARHLDSAVIGETRHRVVSLAGDPHAITAESKWRW